jgi:hypothetical protein
MRDITLDGIRSVKFTLVSLYSVVQYWSIVSGMIGRQEYEEAVGLIRLQLTILRVIFDQEKLDKVSIEDHVGMGFILDSLRALFSARQHFLLQRVFDDMYIDELNGPVKLSEIYNPIYLALNSLDPGAKKVNISPEKEEIVRKVRDFITKKE